MLVTETGPIQRRLEVAWKHHLESVDLRDAPEFLRTGFASIKDEMTRAMPEAQKHARFNLTLSDEQATELARRVLFTLDDLGQMITIAHHKHIFSLLSCYKKQKQEPVNEN